MALPTERVEGGVLLLATLTIVTMSSDRTID
jgi:hypothetical protein